VATRVAGGRWPPRDRPDLWRSHVR